MFTWDRQLGAHLRAMQPITTTAAKPRTLPKKESMTTQGTILKWNGHYGFVAPDGRDPRDQAHHLYLRRAALERSGIKPDAVMCGAKIEFAVQPPRHKGGRDECQDVTLLAA
jgi:hypothetical protein